MARKSGKSTKTDAAKAGEAAAGGDTSPSAGAPEAGAEPAPSPRPEDQPLLVNAQYIKDLSFEAPSAPAIFQQLQRAKPDIAINIDVQVTALQDPAYEVVLNMKAECRVEQQVAFILELAYAGHFIVRVPREHLQAVLLVECPRLLFPFARNVLADVSRDGGFPPILLGPVDFVAMYQRQVQEEGKADGGAPPPGGDGSSPGA